MFPKYNIDKIKFATDSPTLEKAVGIYDTGGVTNFKSNNFGFSAIVRGGAGKYYEVYISAKNNDHGNCNCCLGKNDMLCKYMVAVAIYAIILLCGNINNNKLFVNLRALAPARI